MDKKDVSTPVVVEEKTTEAMPAPVVVDTGVKSYLAMMLLAILAAPLGLARAYRGETIGWVRFWIYIGSYASIVFLWWTIIFAILGFLGILVMTVWGIVDIFLLRNTTTDAAGKPLHGTARDQKWASGFFIASLVGIVITLAMLILGFFLRPLGSNSYDAFRNWNMNPGNTHLNQQYNNTEESELTTPNDDEKQTVLPAYETIVSGMSRSDAEAALGVPSIHCTEYSTADTKTENCTYGGYVSGYVITVTYENNKVIDKTKNVF